MEADRTIAAFTALMGGTGILTGVLQDFESTGSFVEIQSRSHKTAKSAANKAVLLPVLVPAIDSQDSYGSNMQSMHSTRLGFSTLVSGRALYTIRR